MNWQRRFLGVMLCLVVGVAQYAGASAGETLLHLAFDDNVITEDSTHHQNYGVLKGLPAGQSGTCMYFNGIHAYVEVRDAAELELGFGDFCIDLWVKPTQSGSTATLLSKGGAWRVVMYGGGQVGFEYSIAGGGSYSVSSSYGLTLNVWNHVQVERAGGAVVIKIAGTQDGSGTISGNIVDSTEPLLVSAHDSSGTITDRFTGYIDEVDISRPIRLEKDSIIVSDGGVYAIKQDGTLWGLGDDHNGCYFEDGDSSISSPSFRQVRSIWPYSTWEKLTAGYENTMALRSNVFGDNKTLYAWGNSVTGLLGDGTFGTSEYNTNSIINLDWNGQRIWNVYCTRTFNDYTWQAAFICAGQSLASWGYEPLACSNSLRYPVAIKNDLSGYNYRITGGRGAIHLTSIDEPGDMYVWGAYRELDNTLNNEKMYGNGVANSVQYTSPLVSIYNCHWQDMSVALNKVIAIKNDGTLWYWGEDYSSYEQSVPTQIGTDTDWIWCSVTNGFYYAIKSDGTLWTWTYTYVVYPHTYPTTPTQVGTSSSWVAVFPGVGGTLGQSGGYGLQKCDGGYTLWKWLSLIRDQDDDLITITPNPVQVGTDTDWGLPVSRYIGSDTVTLTSPVANEVVDNLPTFTWQPMAGATRYELFVYSRNPDQELIHARELTNTSYTPTTALPDVQLHWTVRAGTSEGWYEWAQPATVRTDASVPYLTFAAPLDGEFNVSDLSADDAPTSNTAVWNGTPGTGLFSDGGYIVPRLNAGVMYPARERSWDGVWSIGFWIKPTTPCYGTTSVFRNNQTLSADSQSGVSINFLTTQWQFQIFHPGQTTLACLHAGTWTVGTWYWIVANRGEDGVVSFYVNGVLMGSNVGNICNGLTNDYAITLGGYPYFPTTGTQFVTQNAQIWNGRTLDPDPTSADATTSVRSYF